MKSKIILIAITLLSITFVQAQTLKPSPEEQQKLGKLRERVLRLRAESETIKVSQHALDSDLNLKIGEINKAISELNAASSEVSEQHKKEWGNTLYNAEGKDETGNSEYGMFYKIDDKKEEPKNGSKDEVKKDEGQNKKEGGKIIQTPKKQK